MDFVPFMTVLSGGCRIVVNRAAVPHSHRSESWRRHLHRFRERGVKLPVRQEKDVSDSSDGAGDFPDLSPRRAGRPAGSTWHKFGKAPTGEADV